MFEAFEADFMQRALIVGIIIGLAGSSFGVFVVQKRLGFLGSGLAHAAFGGVALGLLLSIEPLWIAIPFTLIVSQLIIIFKQKTGISADTITGILFSLSVALGMVFLAMMDNYTVDAMTYLFGSILSVSNTDMIISFVLFPVSGIVFILNWKKWAFSTFDRELAYSDKLNVSGHEYLLAFMIALIIVVSVKIIGIILVSAFLVIPAAAARLISSTFANMTILSMITGLVSVLAGIYYSYQLDIPTGASIILVQSLLFIIFLLIRRLKSWI